MGLTQKQVAAYIPGLTTKSYGAYEEGRAEPSIGTLIDLSRIYGFSSVDQFMEVRTQGRLSEVQQRYMRLPRDKRRIVDFILNTSA